MKQIFFRPDTCEERRDKKNGEQHAQCRSEGEPDTSELVSSPRKLGCRMKLLGPVVSKVCCDWIATNPLNRIPRTNLRVSPRVGPGSRRHGGRGHGRAL